MGTVLAYQEFIVVFVKNKPLGYALNFTEIFPRDFTIYIYRRAKPLKKSRTHVLINIIT